jgi:hypothetical protein
MKAGHHKGHSGHRGEIVSIRAHYSHPKMMSVEVAHGPKPKPPRSKKISSGNMETPFYDNRPTSSVVIPTEQASRYRIGQHVGVQAMPLDGPGSNTGSDDGSDDSRDMDDAMDEYHSTVRGISSYGGSKRKRG